MRDCQFMSSLVGKGLMCMGYNHQRDWVQYMN